MRFQGDGVRLDLRGAKSGSSRVSFKLLVEGDLATALDPDGELTLSFERADYTAVGTVALAGDRFQPGKAGRLVDPSFHLGSFRAALKTGPKDSLGIKGVFDASGPTPGSAPEVVIRLGIFTFTAKADRFTQKGDKWVFSQRVVGTRKVTLDYKKGRVSISLRGVELGAYDSGLVPVTVSVEFGNVRFADMPVMGSNGKSLRY